MSLNWLEVTKFQFISVYVTLKTGMEAAQYCTIFTYGPPISQIEVNSKDITIVSGPGFKPETAFVPTGNNKVKFLQETLPRCIDHG